MEQIKKWIRSIPLWLAFFLTVAIALLIAGFGARATTNMAMDKTADIRGKYLTMVTAPSEGDDVIYQYGLDYHYEDYTDLDMRQYRIYTFIESYGVLIWYSVCILAAGLLFYFTKLQKPLTLLDDASRRISESNLDFTIDYSGSDEMAKLCTTFEMMRSALDKNNQKMIHMIDERKRLNDAYTHDLRTPIAVLKGYSDMLMKYLPNGKMSTDEVLETVSTMSNHVSRLEQFVSSMNTVQKLEDVFIQKEMVVTEEFLNHLQESADILCQSSGLTCDFNGPITENILFIDPSAVIQVYENLLSNAIRFAKSKVTIYLGCKNSFFSISVTDDGRGFSDKDLLKASQPYYSGGTEKSKFHFGLGLHICRTLCEKHDGSLLLENAPQIGAKITAQFSMKK